MNYPLAKELKGAGFPQKEHGTLLFAEGVSLADSQKKWNENSAYVPTLEELISALGKDFDALYSNYSSLTDMQGEEKWRADATNRTGYSVTGKSPTEVLAKLWLTLQKRGA